MWIEQLLAGSKKIETTSPNADRLGHVLNRLSNMLISGIMLVGTAGVVGMFAGQSISI
jgi:hypothetical protein